MSLWLEERRKALTSLKEKVQLQQLKEEKTQKENSTGTKGKVEKAEQQQKSATADQKPKTEQMIEQQKQEKAALQKLASEENMNQSI